MATGYNRIIVMGNLTRDPEYKQLASGQGVCRLGLASNRQYRNKQNGNMVQEVCFVDVDVFGPQAESCRQYLAKGRLVLIEGRLKYDTWEQEGQKRAKHSIVADRVQFLTFSSQNEDISLQQEGRVESQDENFEAATKPYAKKRAKTPRSSTTTSDEDSQSDAGELAYQDEPPFQDDLPF